ncbi:ABC transporter ATP-binding protein [Poritiphilus flavus]|uniref:ATP-binding cassette domain-containing protein n=1 Tax=Poritiphilus flavus TaxID=2697053 RepID=A0A6L9E917_9FLAO|nr:ATP-binding cassette domain-containing protein [Poritiphilus flavus]NAS11240.1 ATP-binding cassette domain-containing protein [Poritiphilus flavus]
MISMQVEKKLHAADGEMTLKLDLQISEGHLVTIYGESGAGKTTTLRILSGLLKPDKGLIEVDGKVWYNSERGICLRPQQRNIGFVFQDYALFPHMSVLQNLQFASKSKADKAAMDRLVELMELGALQHRKPQSLSGGQQQRAALARALVQKPKILLLDEPLSALDYKIRMKLQDHLLEAHQEFGLTTLLISHDISEISKLSDQVVVLKKGEITKQGTAAEVFVDEKISGKFKFTGEVLNIQQQDVVFIVTVRIQNQVVKVIAQQTEIQGIKTGDRVMVASKAFNPVIYKMDP